jgi:hypothetical protein
MGQPPELLGAQTPKVHHARDDLPGLAGRVGGFFALFGQTFQAFVEFRIPMHELDHVPYLPQDPPGRRRRFGLRSIIFEFPDFRR